MGFNRGKNESPSESRKTIENFAASEPEKFKATKGQKGNSFESMQIHHTSFKLLMQPQVGLRKGSAPWS